MCELLGVKNKGLKSLEDRETLKERLNNMGYELINKEKKGRKIYYTIKLISKVKEVLSKVCKDEFKTNLCDSFGMYFKQRDKEEVISKKEVARDSKVNVSTIQKWDKLMLDKPLMGDKGYAYFQITMMDDMWEIEQVDKETYNEFWNVKLKLKKYRVLEKDFCDGKLTPKQLIKRTSEISKMETAIDGYFCYRIKTYSMNREHPLYIDLQYLLKSMNL